MPPTERGRSYASQRPAKRSRPRPIRVVAAPPPNFPRAVPKRPGQIVRPAKRAPVYRPTKIQMRSALAQRRAYVSQGGAVRRAAKVQQTLGPGIAVPHKKVLHQRDIERVQRSAAVRGMFAQRAFVSQGKAVEKVAESQRIKREAKSKNAMYSTDPKVLKAAGFKDAGLGEKIAQMPMRAFLNAPGDAREIATTMPTSIYKLDKTLVTHPEKVPGMLAEPYKQFVKHPVDFATKHPVSTYLMLAPSAKVPMRAAGRIARVAGKQSLRHETATLEGTTIKEHRAGRREAAPVGARSIRAARKPKGEPITNPELNRRTDEFWDWGQQHKQAAVDSAIREAKRESRKAKQPKAERRAAADRAMTGSGAGAHQHVERALAHEFGSHWQVRHVPPEHTSELVGEHTITKRAAPSTPAASTGERMVSADFGKGGTHTRKSTHDYTHASLKDGQVRFHKTEAAARKRGGTVVETKLHGRGGAPRKVPEPPKKILKKSGRFELHQYTDGRYGVVDTRTGELMADAESKGAKGGKLRNEVRAEERLSAWGYHESLPGGMGDTVKLNAKRTVPYKMDDGWTGKAEVIERHGDDHIVAFDPQVGLVTIGKGGKASSGGTLRTEFGRARHAQLETTPRTAAAAPAKPTGPRSFTLPVRRYQPKTDPGGVKIVKPTAAEDGGFIHKTRVDAQHVADAIRHEGHFEPKVIKLEGATPGATSGYAVVPRQVAARYARHKRVGSGGFAGGPVLRVLGRSFRQTTLPLSPKWLYGQATEAGIRAVAQGAGPISYARGRAILKASDAAGSQLRRRAVSGGQFGGTGAVGHALIHDPRTPKTIAEEFTDSDRLAHGAQIVTDIAAKPVIRHVRAGYRRYTNVLFNEINGRIEAAAKTAMLGKAVKTGPLMERRIIGLGDKAIQEAADGLHGTAAQVELARAVDRSYGRYSKFSPSGRDYILHTTPYIPWFINMVQFLGHVMPHDHPLKTSLLASLNVALEDYRKKNRLSTHGPHVPDFMLGSAPGKGRDTFKALARYGPALPGDFTGSFGGQITPQLQGAIFALAGVDWTGAPIRGPHGQTAGQGRKAAAAGLAGASALIPGVGIADRVTGLGDHYVMGKTKKPSVIQGKNVLKGLEDIAKPARDVGIKDTKGSGKGNTHKRKGPPGPLRLGGGGSGRQLPLGGGGGSSKLPLG